MFTSDLDFGGGVAITGLLDLDAVAIVISSKAMYAVAIAAVVLRVYDDYMYMLIVD